MSNPLRSLNDLLAFALELVALVALGYWGAKVGVGLGWKIGLGVGAPLAAAVLWGLFAAPKAPVVLPLVAVLAVKALFFGAAVAALYTLGHRGLATALGVVVVVNIAVAVAITRGSPA